MRLPWEQSTAGTRSWSRSPSSSHDANGCWSDVFRLGQPAVSSLLRCHVAGRGIEVLQRRPSWVKLVVVVRRVFCQVRSTLGTQARTVAPAYGLERHGRNHGIPEHGLEVEQVAHELVHLVIIVLGRHLVVVSRAIGVGEQLLEMTPTWRVIGSRHRTQAPVAVACAEPVTRTPSMTDSNRRSSSMGWPGGMAIRSMSPRSSGAGTVRCISSMDPGRRPSSRVSNTRGRRGFRRFMASDDGGLSSIPGWTRPGLRSYTM